MGYASAYLSELQKIKVVRVAQLAERKTENLEVTSSTLVPDTGLNLYNMIRSDILSVFRISSNSSFSVSLFQFAFSKNIYIYVYSTWFFFFSLLLRYSTTLHKTYFVDLNAFEVNKTLAFKTSLGTNLNILMYTFYSTRVGQKIVLLTHNTINIFSKTLNSLFQNIMWVEREISEMFGVQFDDKKDNRRLLLDFSYIGNPMLKSHPVTGFIEVYFNAFKQWIEYGKCLFQDGERPISGFDN